jgi:opacity protein-like surface antigen
VSLSQTKPGLALGGGAEWRIAEHWLLRGEYLYMMFDTIKGSGQIACTPGVGNCAPGGNSTTFAYKTNFTENVARLAISYQF